MELKVHYRVHMMAPVVHIIVRASENSTNPNYFVKINVNINLPFVSRSSEWPFIFTLLKDMLYSFLIDPLRATCFAHLILFDLIILVIFD